MVTIFLEVPCGAAVCRIGGYRSGWILFRLETRGLIVVMAAVAGMLPVLILDMYKGMYERRRFADVTAYMEQMLYAFQKEGKVVTALKDVGKILQPDDAQRDRGGDHASGRWDAKQ